MLRKSPLLLRDTQELETEESRCLQQAQRWRVQPPAGAGRHAWPELHAAAGWGKRVGRRAAKLQPCTLAAQRQQRQQAKASKSKNVGRPGAVAERPHVQGRRCAAEVHLSLPPHACTQARAKAGLLVSSNPWADRYCCAPWQRELLLLLNSLPARAARRSRKCCRCCTAAPRFKASQLRCGGECSVTVAAVGTACGTRQASFATRRLNRAA